ncbi:hypothetical protein [Jeotgalicoccus psychrophilus]|uniref:hypothetical protein n=1 Tax=Jeotgalicoccus psychrophilus TaxID=157228 RepID=UPI001469AA5B|nr:hypothetical protein [Jeotgalicoccus psychrophilus]
MPEQGGKIYKPDLFSGNAACRCSNNRGQILFLYELTVGIIKFKKEDEYRYVR